MTFSTTGKPSNDFRLTSEPPQPLLPRTTNEADNPLPSEEQPSSAPVSSASNPVAQTLSLLVGSTTESDFTSKKPDEDAVDPAVLRQVDRHFAGLRARITAENIRDDDGSLAAMLPHDRAREVEQRVAKMQQDFDTMTEEIAVDLTHHGFDTTRLSAVLERATSIDRFTMGALGLTNAMIFNTGGAVADVVAPAGVAYLRTIYGLSEDVAERAYSALAAGSLMFADTSLTGHMVRSAFGYRPFYFAVRSPSHDLHPTMVRLMNEFGEPAPGFMGQFGEVSKALAPYTARNELLASSKLAPVDQLPWFDTVGETAGGFAAGVGSQVIGIHAQRQRCAYGPHMLLSSKQVVPLLLDAEKSMALHSGRGLANVTRGFTSIGTAFLPPAVIPRSMGGREPHEMPTVYEKFVPQVVQHLPSALFSAAALAVGFFANTFAKQKVKHAMTDEAGRQNPWTAFTQSQVNVAGKFVAYELAALGLTTGAQIEAWLREKSGPVGSARPAPSTETKPLTSADSPV